MSVGRGVADFDGAALRSFRLNKQGAHGRPLSAQELAALVGTSKARILAYESERSIPEPKRIVDLATVLGVPPKQLSVSDAGYYAIRDMRYHTGRTAAELAADLGISRAAYRDIEREALLPVRDDGTLTLRLSTALDQPLRLVQRALEQHPVATARRTQIADHLSELFHQAGHKHVPAVVDASDVHLQAIAGILRRSIGVVCRLLNYELSQYRQLLADRAAREAEAAYAQSARAGERARAAVLALNNRIETAPASVASTLNRFLAEAMNGRQWRAVVQLYNTNWRLGTLHHVEDPSDEETWKALQQRGFIEEVGATNAVFPTERGVRQVRSQAARYGCLYPRIPAPILPQPRRRSQLAHVSARFSDTRIL